MMYLIVHEGAELLVGSLDGYEGCELVESEVPDPPCDTHWCRRLDGQWIVDEAAKAAAEENARLAALTPAELVAEIASRADAAIEAMARSAAIGTKPEGGTAA